MAWEDAEGWRHGRVWRGKKGRLSYYIRKDGRDYATGASTLSGAEKALERFEKKGTTKVAKPVFLDVDLATEYLDNSKQKGNSVEWRRNQRQHLDWWARRPQLGKKDGGGLAGMDLRTGRHGSISITDIRTALDGATSARQKEAVIRSLYTYLRGEDRIETDEDPTYGKPRISPASRPAQDTASKFIETEDLETVLGYLDEKWMERGKTDEERNHRGRRWADLLRLLDGTGMHVSEAARFAASGEVEPLPASRKKTKKEAAVLLVPLHKSGAPFRVAVSAATEKVAKRVREAGTFSVAVFYAELRKAGEACGARVLPGRFRHTVAKHAVEAGATVGQVGDYLGHKSPSTTKKFYSTLAVPTKPPTRR